MDSDDPAGLHEPIPGKPVLERSLLAVVAINKDEIYRFVTDCSLAAVRLEPSNGAVPNPVDLVMRNPLVHAEPSRPGENGSTAESTPSEAMTDLNREVVTPCQTPISTSRRRPDA